MKKEMFSKVFDPDYISSLLECPAPDAKEVKEILNKSDPSLEQVAVLVSAFPNFLLRQRVVEEAVTRRTKKWGDKLFLMPPLYISDGDSKRGGCLDHCIYCSWRNGNVPAGQIRRLTVEEARAEALHLISLGYGDVELVAATDPELLRAEKAAEFVRVAKEVGAKNIGINFFPFRRASDYRRLATAGCTFAIVWQETYLLDVYRQMHPRGPKANFTCRLDAHDRACQGDISTVGVAFLGGLADWRLEALATIVHAQHLRKEYGAEIIFGMPRWKYGTGALIQTVPSFYGDAEYEFVGALYSLAVAEALVWFSTREHFDLSVRCARGGGCLFTLDCSTAVGGYTSTNGFSQFPVYSGSFAEGVEWLQELGFDPQTHLPW